MAESARVAGKTGTVAIHIGNHLAGRDHFGNLAFIASLPDEWLFDASY